MTVLWFASASKSSVLAAKRRQNLLFSATMPSSIANLAGSFLHNAIKVDITPEEVTVDRIDQKIMFLRKADKRRLWSKSSNKNGWSVASSLHGQSTEQTVLSSSWIKAVFPLQQSMETKAKEREPRHWLVSRTAQSRFWWPPT